MILVKTVISVFYLENNSILQTNRSEIPSYSIHIKRVMLVVTRRCTDLVIIMSYKLGVTMQKLSPSAGTRET